MKILNAKTDNNDYPVVKQLLRTSLPNNRASLVSLLQCKNLYIIINILCEYGSILLR